MIFGFCICYLQRGLLRSFSHSQIWSYFLVVEFLFSFLISLSPVGLKPSHRSSVLSCSLKLLGSSDWSWTVIYPNHELYVSSSNCSAYSFPATGCFFAWLCGVLSYICSLVFSNRLKGPSAEMWRSFPDSIFLSDGLLWEFQLSLLPGTPVSVSSTPQYWSSLLSKTPCLLATCLLHASYMLTTCTT